jgi:hypothetical protein
MTVEERAFDTMDAAAGALVQALEQDLNAAIAARGRALLMVSGGGTSAEKSRCCHLPGVGTFTADPNPGKGPRPMGMTNLPF